MQNIRRNKTRSDMLCFSLRYIALCFKSWISWLTFSSAGMNCRLDYCQTSTSMFIPTSLHCSLRMSLWIRSWSCLRSRYWSAGSTTTSHGHRANARCPTSHQTSRIPSCTSIFWIRLLRRTPALPRRPSMYVDWLPMTSVWHLPFVE